MPEYDRHPETRRLSDEEMASLARQVRLRQRETAAEAESERLWSVLEEAVQDLDFLELPAFREDHGAVLSLADRVRSLMLPLFVEQRPDA